MFSGGKEREKRRDVLGFGIIGNQLYLQIFQRNILSSFIK